MPRLLRIGALLIVAFGLSGFGGVESLFAPKAELWERWDASDEASQTVIDHAPWQRFLDNYVKSGADGVNRVAYSRVSAMDHKALDDYLGQLARSQVTALSRPEQFAYWVNLYNALTVKVILEHQPVETIRDINISPGFFSSGPWDKKLLEIEGEAVSLNDIEHRILRPIWGDPRIHYAVNCASIGCPNLQKTAFTAANTETLLEKSARDYINHSRGVRRGEEGVVLSSIYAWFTDDFGGNLSGVVAHLKKYANADIVEALDSAEEFQDGYDWSLNGTN